MRFVVDTPDAILNSCRNVNPLMFSSLFGLHTGKNHFYYYIIYKIIIEYYLSNFSEDLKHNINVNLTRFTFLLTNNSKVNKVKIRQTIATVK